MVGLYLAGSHREEKEDVMMRIGFHTDAFNSSYWDFEKCLQWAQANSVHQIE